MELLVRAKDKPINNNEDVKYRTTRGDVIVAMPDGHIWSKRELENPDWIIIKTPSSEQFIASLLEPELNIDDQSDILRRRGYYVDLDNINVPKTINHRLEPISITDQKTKEVRTQKTPIKSENVIGPSDRIIG